MQKLSDVVCALFFCGFFLLIALSSLHWCTAVILTVFWSNFHMAYFIIKTGDLRVDGIAFMGGKK